MNGTINLEKFIPQTRRAFGLGVLTALAVLAITILSGLFFVRDLVRNQIIQRDAEAWTEIVQPVTQTVVHDLWRYHIISAAKRLEHRGGGCQARGEQQGIFTTFDLT